MVRRRFGVRPAFGAWARVPARWLVAAAAVSLLIGSAAAQDAEKSESAADEEKSPPPKVLALDIALAGRQTSGNANKLHQYSSPPTGLYLRELAFQPASVPYDGYGLLTLRGYGSDDIRSDVELGLNGDTTRVWWSAGRTRFFDNTSQVIPESSRRTDALTLRYMPAPDYAITWQYGTSNVNRFFESPQEDLRVRSRSWDLTAYGKVGDGSLGVGVADTRFYDRMLTLPNTSMQSWRVMGLWSPCPTADVTGSVTGRTFERSGVGVGRANEVALAGSMGLGALGDVTVRGMTESYNWPDMEGPYVRDRRMVETALASRVGPMGLRLKWQYREAERVRGDGDYLDVPKWTTFSGRMSGRLGKLARLTLKGSTERMWQRPQMALTDTRSAIWDSRDGFEAKLDASTDALTGYASWRFARRGNAERGTNVTSGIASAGATWNVSPNMELFGEVSFETWRGRNEESVYPTLGSFMPDSRVTSLGLSYALGPRTFFWGGYTDTATNNDNPLLKPDANTHARYLTLSLRHRLATGDELTLSVAPWTYRDTVDPTMNVTATTVVLSCRGRF